MGKQRSEEVEEEGKQLSLSRLSAVSYFIKVHPLLLSLPLSSFSFFTGLSGWLVKFLTFWQRSKANSPTHTRCDTHTHTHTDYTQQTVEIAINKSEANVAP